MERAREDDANEDDEDRAAGCLPSASCCAVVCTQETLTLEQVREECKSLFEKGRRRARSDLTLCW